MSRFKIFDDEYPPKIEPSEDLKAYWDQILFFETLEELKEHEFSSRVLLLGVETLKMTGWWFDGFRDVHIHSMRYLPRTLDLPDITIIEFVMRDRHYMVSMTEDWVEVKSETGRDRIYHDEI